MPEHAIKVSGLVPAAALGTGAPNGTKYLRDDGVWALPLAPGYTAAPTTGTWTAGDVVRNTAPAELGVALAKYVITGWICVTGGTPGTWLTLRSLTGA